MDADLPTTFLTSYGRSAEKRQFGCWPLALDLQYTDLNMGSGQGGTLQVVPHS